MQRRKFTVCSAALLASLTLSIAAEVSATGGQPLPSPGVSTPPRECTVAAPVAYTWPVQYVNVKIQAGPNGEGGLATEFPVSEPCPEGVSSDTGQCLRWDYLWTILTAGASFDKTLTSVDSDITVHTATPAATVVNSLPGFFVFDTDGERFLKFNAYGTSFTASYVTPASVTAGTLTAAFTGKKSHKWFSGRCPLAGADNFVLQQNQAIAAQQQFKLAGCTVAYTPDAFGKVIPGSLMIIEGAENCSVEETTNAIIVDGKPVVFVGAVQFTQGGSCNYSWTNTTGGRSTVNCSTCCINNTTGQCVLKSSLSNPTTQCRAGTL
jgi:hypothetical protein